MPVPLPDSVPTIRLRWTVRKETCVWIFSPQFAQAYGRSTWTGHPRLATVWQYTRTGLATNSCSLHRWQFPFIATLDSTDLRGCRAVVCQLARCSLHHHVG